MLTTKSGFFSALTLLAIATAPIGCTDIDTLDTDDTVRRTESEVIIENLKAAGFPEAEIDVLTDGTVFVGGDAVVTLQASREMAGIVDDLDSGFDGNFRQYRTTNIIDTTQVDTICIRTTDSYEGVSSMVTALDNAIANYNSESLQFTMKRIASDGNDPSCDAEILADVDNSGGGIAGFPESGRPYTNLTVDQNLANDYGTSVATHVITHELGHCVGFRHTDYYNRSISCGGANSNEGEADVGAEHIPGTPTDATENGSVMNACFNLSSTGDWTPDDQTALDCLYDSGSCAPAPPPSYELISTDSNQSASKDSEVAYGPFDATGLDAIRFSMSGGSGDADLYVRFGSAPTTAAYDCRPWLSGNSETCEFNPAQSGEYYVMIAAYAAYSGVTLTVEGTGNVEPEPEPDPEVCNDGFDNDDDGDTDCEDSDCSEDDACQAPPGDWVELSSTDFEGSLGVFNDGGSDARLLNNNAYSQSGSYVAEIRDNSNSRSSIFTDAFDLSDYTTLKVDYHFYSRSMENGEDFLVELHNGSSWQVIAQYARGTHFDNDSTYIDSIEVSSADFDFDNQAKLRFRCDASGNSDWIYIDDVVISAK